MRLELTRLHRKLGATMIYVTHDQVEAMTLADKIFVLKSGVLQQAGAPLTLYDDPDNRFVAGFIGSPAMNFLSAKVIAQGNGIVTLELEGGDRPLQAALSGPLSIGQTVEIGIRPEHLLIRADGALPVTVEVAEELGDLSYLYTRTRPGKEVIVQRQGSRESLDGKAVSLFADARHIMVFDSEGNRLR